MCVGVEHAWTHSVHPQSSLSVFIMLWYSCSVFTALRCSCSVMKPTFYLHQTTSWLYIAWHYTWRELATAQLHDWDAAVRVKLHTRIGTSLLFAHTTYVWTEAKRKVIKQHGLGLRMNGKLWWLSHLKTATYNGVAFRLMSYGKLAAHKFLADTIAIHVQAQFHVALWEEGLGPTIHDQESHQHRYTSCTIGWTM